MEDMASALGNILQNPQAMQQIMNLASQLGLSQEAPAPQAETPPAAPVMSIPAAPQSAQTGLPGMPENLDIATITKVAQILGSVNMRDRNVELLLALKPHFGEKRRKKVDDAIRVMQLIKVLPALRETGLFSNLFGGGDS